MTDKPTKQQAEAKARVRKWMTDPKHKRKKGDPDDEATRTGDIEDPAMQQEDTE